MKVIHILHELKFSGAEIMYVDAAPYFQELGCELTVVATTPSVGEFAPFFEKAGYKVLHLPLPKLTDIWGRIKYYSAFIKLIKKEKYDVIHIHTILAYWGLALCALLTNKRSVFTFHSVYLSRKYSYLYHFIIRWTAKNLFRCRYHTISDSVYKHELTYYFNKTNIVYNWYGASRFFPGTAEEKSAARKELGIDENAFVFISVGGCSPIKRHSEIIKAMPGIIEKLPNCLYLHLGSGVSEPEEIKLAEELGVQNNIRFCGNQTGLRKYLLASNVYLMTSVVEGISLTTIEAMACEVPAILYNVPGLRDFNKTGNNSILIPEDPKILAETIIKVQSNPDAYKEMSENARNFVNHCFYIKTNVAQIYNLYKK